MKLDVNIVALLEQVARRVFSPASFITDVVDEDDVERRAKQMLDVCFGRPFLTTHRNVGVKALPRWNDLKQGLVPPARFMQTQVHVDALRASS